MHKRFYHFFVSHSIFYESQYGFRPGHATNHAVHEFEDDTINAIEDK